MIKLVSPVLGVLLTWLLGNLKYIVRGIFVLDCAGAKSGCFMSVIVPGILLFLIGCLSGTVSPFKLFKKCFSTDYKSNFLSIEEKNN